ncbi:hypothetical protein ACTSKR_02690 [Chitinibacteraceae bacterium HSL-7]
MLFCFAIFALSNFTQNKTWLFGDAHTYWSLAERLFEPGAFYTSIRGYFYPALIAPIALTFSWAGWEIQRAIFLLVSAVVWSWFYARYLPRFLRAVFPTWGGGYRPAVAVALSVLIFPGIFAYPLADLPALTFIIFGIHLSVLVVVDDEIGFGKRLLWAVAAGACAYAAYNIRTIYLFAAMALFIALSLGLQRRPEVRVSAICAFIFGWLLISIPQGVINLAAHNEYSTKVATERAGRSLFAAQLFWGLAVQRYETNIDRQYRPTVFYPDPDGIKLVQELNVKGVAPSVGAYFKLALKEPGFFSGLYVRHVLAALDIRDGEIYTSSRAANKIIWGVLVALLVAFAIVTLIDKASREGWLGLCAMVCILSPVVFIVPGAIETRFFLPLYFLAVCALASTKRISTRMLGASLATAVLIFMYGQSISDKYIYAMPAGSVVQY